MAKAIKVTTENKADNPEFFSGNVVGNIYAKALPRNYKGVETLNAGGYHTRTDLHLQDGFKDIVQPTFNTSTQKRGNTLIDNLEDENTCTYNVVDLTAEEIATNAQNALDNDEASQFFNQRRSDGQIYLDRLEAYLYRQVVNGDVTKPQAIFALNFFYMATLPLTRGYFEKALELTTALASGNQSIIAIKNKIVNELQNYIDNE